LLPVAGGVKVYGDDAAATGVHAGEDKLVVDTKVPAPHVNVIDPLAFCVKFSTGRRTASKTASYEPLVGKLTPPPPDGTDTALPDVVPSKLVPRLSVAISIQPLSPDKVSLNVHA
jgi:hypothetical protein